MSFSESLRRSCVGMYFYCKGNSVTDGAVLVHAASVSRAGADVKVDAESGKL